jgi:hypothetical protein
VVVFQFVLVRQYNWLYPIKSDLFGLALSCFELIVYADFVKVMLTIDLEISILDKNEGIAIMLRKCQMQWLGFWE